MALPAACVFLVACSTGPAAKEAQPEPERRVRITQFYASPPDPEPGAKTLLCYGMDNALQVRIDPPVGEVWPAKVRCLELTPKTPITYTLTAERGADRVSQSFTIRRGAPPVEILEVRVDALEVAPGTLMHVCYKTRNAGSVSILPPGEPMPGNTPDRGCFLYTQAKTTTYTVQARDVAGDIIDGEEVTVQVR